MAHSIFPLGSTQESLRKWREPGAKLPCLLQNVIRIKANLFFARLSAHLCLAEKVPSSYLPGASVIEALRSCLPHVSLRLFLRTLLL